MKNILLFFILLYSQLFVQASLQDKFAIRDTFTNNIRGSIMRDLNQAFLNYYSSEKVTISNPIQTVSNRIINYPTISTTTVLAPVYKPPQTIQLKSNFNIQNQNTLIPSVQINQLQSPIFKYKYSVQPQSIFTSKQNNSEIPQLITAPTYTPLYKTIQQIPPHVIIAKQQSKSKVILKPFQSNIKLQPIVKSQIQINPKINKCNSEIDSHIIIQPTVQNQNIVEPYFPIHYDPYKNQQYVPLNQVSIKKPIQQINQPPILISASFQPCQALSNPTTLLPPINSEAIVTSSSSISQYLETNKTIPSNNIKSGGIIPSKNSQTQVLSNNNIVTNNSSIIKQNLRIIPYQLVNQIQSPQTIQIVTPLQPQTQSYINSTLIKTNGNNRSNMRVITIPGQVSQTSNRDQQHRQIISLIQQYQTLNQPQIISQQNQENQQRLNSTPNDQSQTNQIAPVINSTVMPTRLQIIQPNQIQTSINIPIVNSNSSQFSAPSNQINLPSNIRVLPSPSDISLYVPLFEGNGNQSTNIDNRNGNVVANQSEYNIFENISLLNQNVNSNDLVSQNIFVNTSPLRSSLQPNNQIIQQIPPQIQVNGQVSQTNESINVNNQTNGNMSIANTVNENSLSSLPQPEVISLSSLLQNSIQSGDQQLSSLLRQLLLFNNVNNQSETQNQTNIQLNNIALGITKSSKPNKLQIKSLKSPIVQNKNQQKLSNQTQLVTSQINKIKLQQILSKIDQHFRNKTLIYQKCQFSNQNKNNLNAKLELNKCKLQYQNSKAIHEAILMNYRQNSTKPKTNIQKIIIPDFISIPYTKAIEQNNNKINILSVGGFITSLTSRS